MARCLAFSPSDCSLAEVSMTVGCQPWRWPVRCSALPSRPRRAVSPATSSVTSCSCSTARSPLPDCGYWGQEMNLCVKSNPNVCLNHDVCLFCQKQDAMATTIWKDYENSTQYMTAQSVNADVIYSVKSTWFSPKSRNFARNRRFDKPWQTISIYAMSK